MDLNSGLISLSENDELLLLIAAEKGRTDILEQLISNYPLIGLFNWNVQNVKGKTPIMIAARENHFDFVNKLLPFLRSDDLTIESDEKLNALSYAAVEGHLDIVKTLIPRQDANSLNKPDSYGQTLLHWAAKHGYDDIIELLISRYTELNVENYLYWQDNEWFTPLMRAAQNGHAKIFSALTNSKVNSGINYISNIRDKKNNLTAFKWALKNNNLNIVRCLLALDSNEENVCFELFELDDEDQLELTYEIHNLNEDIILELIPYFNEECLKAVMFQNEYVEMREEEGGAQKESAENLLFFAAKKGNVNIIEALILRSTELQIVFYSYLSSRDEFGFTALMYAAKNGHINVVNLLLLHLDSDAINKTDRFQDSALAMAIQCGHFKIAEMIFNRLLEQKADLKLCAVGSVKLTTLDWAAAKGDDRLIRMIIEEMVKINQPSVQASVDIALLYAVGNGHLKATQNLYFNYTGEKLNARDNNGQTAMILAAKGGYVDILDLLKKHFAKNIHEDKDNEGMTPLMHAAAEGQILTLRSLLEKGADTTVKDKKRRTALMHAICSDEIEIYHTLIEYYDVKALIEPDSSGNTMFMIAAKNGNLDLLRELSSRIKDPIKLVGSLNAQNIKGETALMLAAKQGYLSVVKLLISLGVDPYRVDKAKRNAIYYALCSKHIYTIDSLLPFYLKKAKIDHKDKRNRTALMLAAENGLSGTVKKLLDHKANPNLKNKDGCTALMIAIDSFETAAAHVLMKHLDVGKINNQDNKNKNTLLTLAAKADLASVVEVLVYKGANVSLLNKLNESALSCAILNNNVEILNILMPQVEKSALNTPNQKGQTLYMDAAKCGSLEALQSVEYYLQKSNIVPDHQLRDHQGCTALILACKNGHTHIVSALLPRINSAVLNILDNSGKTALMHAALLEDTSVLKILLPHCDLTELNREDPDGNTAWFFSCTKKTMVEFNAFLSRYQEIDPLSLNHQNSRGMTILMQAVISNNSNVVKTLIDLKDDINLNVQDNEGNTALIHACELNYSGISMMLIMQICGTDPGALNIGNNRGMTAFITTIVKNHIEMAQYFINWLPTTSLNFADNQGCTPLMHACKIFCPQLSKRLIDIISEDDVLSLNITDNQGKTALMHAAEMGCYETVDYLLSNVKSGTLNLNAVDLSGKSALFIAAYNERDRIVQKLYPFYDIQNIDLGTLSNLSSLMQVAIIMKDLDRAKFLIPLLEKEDLLNSKTCSDKTYIMLACSFSSQEMIAFLLEQNININYRNQFGNTALLLASYKNSTEVTKTLLSSSLHIDLNIANQFGATALMNFARSGNFEIVELFIAKGANLHLKDNTGNSVINYSLVLKNKSVSYRLISAMMNQSSALVSDRIIQTPTLNTLYLDLKASLSSLKNWLFHRLYIFRKHPALENELNNRIVSNLVPNWYQHLAESNMSILLAQLEERLEEKRNPKPPQITLVSDPEPVIMRPQASNAATNGLNRQEVVSAVSERRYPTRNRSFKGSYKC